MTELLAHPPVKELADFGLGLLEESACQRIASHLEDCDDCQRTVAEAAGDTFTELLVGAKDVLEAPRPGETIPPELVAHPRYTPLKLLGIGGMGTVWLAEHAVMGRRVAVKIIRPEFLARPGAGQRFRREVAAAARLHHPNIVTAFDAEQAGDVHFLAMEYIEGVGLDELLKEKGALPVADACRYALDAANGLEHAHRAGLVHRDVKPGNLMRAIDGSVKVLDFGLAMLAADERVDTSLTGANMVVGTPDYIAPEQAEHPQAADNRADIYALGCTLYHLLTGVVPFPGSSVLKKLDSHRQDRPKPLTFFRQDIPGGLAEVLAKMMTKDPADRYPSAAAVATALRPYIDAATTPPRKRRGWSAAIAAGFFFLALVAAGVIYRVQTDKGELVISSQSDDVEVVIKQGGKLVTIIDTKTQKKLELKSGEYDLELRNAEGLKLDITRATLMRGEKVLASIIREPLMSVSKEVYPRIDASSLGGMMPLTPDSIPVPRSATDNEWQNRVPVPRGFKEPSPTLTPSTIKSNEEPGLRIPPSPVDTPSMGSGFGPSPLGGPLKNDDPQPLPGSSGVAPAPRTNAGALPTPPTNVPPAVGSGFGPPPMGERIPNNIPQPLPGGTGVSTLPRTDSGVVPPNPMPPQIGLPGIAPGSTLPGVTPSPVVPPVDLSPDTVPPGRVGTPSGTIPPGGVGTPRYPNPNPPTMPTDFKKENPLVAPPKVNPLASVKELPTQSGLMCRLPLWTAEFYEQMRFSADERLIGIHKGDRIVVLDTVTGNELSQIDFKKQMLANWLGNVVWSFSADSKKILLVYCDPAKIYAVKQWNIESGDVTQMGGPIRLRGEINYVANTNEATKIVFIVDNSYLCIYDSTTQQIVRKINLASSGQEQIFWGRSVISSDGLRHYAIVQKPSHQPSDIQVNFLTVDRDPIKIQLPNKLLTIIDIPTKAGKVPQEPLVGLVCENQNSEVFINVYDMNGHFRKNEMCGYKSNNLVATATLANRSVVTVGKNLDTFHAVDLTTGNKSTLIERFPHQDGLVLSDRGRVFGVRKENGWNLYRLPNPPQAEVTPDGTLNLVPYINRLFTPKVGLADAQLRRIEMLMDAAGEISIHGSTSIDQLDAKLKRLGLLVTSMITEPPTHDQVKKFEELNAKFIRIIGENEKQHPKSDLAKNAPKLELKLRANGEVEIKMPRANIEQLPRILNLIADPNDIEFHCDGAPDSKAKFALILMNAKIRENAKLTNPKSFPESPTKYRLGVAADGKLSLEGKAIEFERLSKLPVGSEVVIYADKSVSFAQFRKIVHELSIPKINVLYVEEGNSEKGPIR